MEKGELSWEAPEFDYIEKEPFWFVSVGLFAAVLFLFALWQKNLLFAIFLLVATIVVFIWAKKKPGILTFILNENGLRVGDHDFYPWRDLEYFAILKSHEERDALAELIIKRDKKTNPFLKIHIPPDQLNNIRGFLVKFLPEEEYEESFPDAIGRIIKF